MTEQITTATPQQVQYLDPASLLIDVNVRTAASADDDLTESVRDLGVLQPIIAVRTSDGAVRVRYGHRRTLAALAASLPTVPVLVVADETTDDEAQVDRLVRQYAENEHRANLTTAERMGVASQLSAFGVSPAQIAKRTRMPRAHVDAALTVAGSALATGAAERYDFLDLTQAAVLAEFEGEPETVKALVVAARDGQFDHVAQRARDARALREQHEQAAADLTAQGVQVIERPAWNEAPRRLSGLTHNGEPITTENHAECPGHAAFLDLRVKWVRDEPEETEPEETEPEDADQEEGVDQDEDGDLWDDEDDDDRPTRTVETLTPVYVCTDPKAHGHHDRHAASGASTKPLVADMSEAEREQAKNERRDVIESNRAWKSAETVRRDWLRQFATRKSAPRGAPQFIAASLMDRNYSLTKAIETGHHLACDLLGTAAPATGYGRRPVLVDDKTTGPRAQVLALVLLLAAYEEATGTHSWRNVSPDIARYLRWIEANGYVLSDVERRACGEDPLPVTTGGDQDVQTNGQDEQPED